MPPGPGLVSERALARTYHSHSYADAYDAVEDYRRVTRYASEQPQEGSSAVSSALELPRGRIRPWLNGSKPNPVHAIETARNYGWLNCTYDDPEFDPLNTLVASVFSGGSITVDNYQPSFPLDDEGNHVVDALELADVEYTVVDDRDGRADEIRPTTDGTVLGRVLAVLGAPTGPKAKQHLSLPDYLEDAPTAVREQFVDAYLEHRAVNYRGKDTLCIQEQRNREYLTDLADLLNDVADGGVALRERNIVITADASRRLGAVN
ncbi:hypothetical protein [Natronobacterium gregoryi]|uniref:Uncharacterized protein n=2 Tax=Natronobacterium gregoryi TaxID=44930 RepID=L0AED0_NATGS|nr:hypothetical protein [Natronobacterium gregoryi]AFZ71420.1 hypothetical protein Natgr_0156 [Natronobacterium gregoryi SP2]ELY66945.1 hypothetical protein C490_11933 [Natronobacterium gregoryi SP2]PLK21200.1 hypothetical protein CYV19_05115 [Natronobacterium gregoryi SP2]SFI84234.1 hypothetical protein SAMN05443661_10713 [Natronobacterium gregoryi]